MSSMFSVLCCVSAASRTSCKSDQNLCGSDKNILFLGVTQHNRILTRTKVLLATETERKMEKSVFGVGYIVAQTM